MGKPQDRDLQGDKREEFKKFIVENELAEANTIKVHGHG